MNLPGGKQKSSEISFPIGTFYTTNSTWTDLGSNQDLWGEGYQVPQKRHVQYMICQCLKCLSKTYYDFIRVYRLRNTKFRQHPTFATTVFLAMKYSEFVAARAGGIKLWEPRCFAAHRRHQLVCFYAPVQCGGLPGWPIAFLCSDTWSPGFTVLTDHSDTQNGSKLTMHSMFINRKAVNNIVSLPLWWTQAVFLEWWWGKFQSWNTTMVVCFMIVFNSKK